MMTRFAVFATGGAGEDRQAALWSPMSEEIVLQALQQILDVVTRPSCERI